ncbi:NAD(P)/FAD-dependent oxidoreductase [Trichloromonas sp.]|uniref:NAD(P)/FAD-dependent oxidoreductase n=1 Tax=Trichloromonas sp. TaxID=3069249 RepID=UPI003D817EB2
MGKHLVLVGGGHAHLTMLKNLRVFVDRGHRITLVSPGEYHYYSGMGPGLLSGLYAPNQVRFHVARMAIDRGAAFIRDRVVGIDADRRLLLLASGEPIPYDIASFNTGSSVPDSLRAGKPSCAVPVKPISCLLEARQRILAGLPAGRMRLVVVGGGPAGIELCGNLWRLVRDAGGRAELTLVGGSRLLGGFPGRVRLLALASLAERGIRVLEGVKAQAVEENRVLLSDGDEIPCDLALLAVGVQPSAMFAESGLAVGADGGLLVDDTLRSLSSPELFGGGDCICLQSRPLPKVGVFAVRQNPILYHNLMAALEEEAMRHFVPQKMYLLILNLGNGRGILQRGRLVFGGRWPFLLKDWIDRRFMAGFQLSRERDEVVLPTVESRG